MAVQFEKPIALGADHGGYELKEAIKQHLEERGIAYRDFGTNSTASCDYPDYAAATCGAVTNGSSDFAILCCGTGVGMSMCANKIKGIRACCCSEPFSAEYTRRHNNANTLCLGGRVVGPGLACQIVDAFLDHEFEGGRHQKRIDKMMALETRKTKVKGGRPLLQLTRRYLRQIDGIFLALCAACSVLSVVTLVSIGHNQLGSINKASVQFIASALGILLALIVSTVDYRALARAWPLHAVLAWGMVLPTLFLHNVRLGFLTVGYDVGGTSNYSWYRVGGMTFQPAELAKISFVLTLALHLNHVRGRVNKPANLLALAVHVLLPVLAIHIQGDDGTALVFLGIGLVMVFAGGISGWLVAGGLAAAGGGAALLLKLRPGLLKGYQAKRIFAVLDPENPALADIAYQQNKGAMAIGTGGLTGTGLWGEHVFVPNSWNDFIFSYLANAMGFVGAVTVLLLLLGISVRILLAALQSTDALGRYLCVGIFAALFWQCIINLGMNLQVLPVIGVTLPFFSAGGSSVVMVYLCVGLVLAVSRKNRRKKLAVPIELEQV